MIVLIVIAFFLQLSNINREQEFGVIPQSSILNESEYMNKYSYINYQFSTPSIIVSLLIQSTSPNTVVSTTSSPVKNRGSIVMGIKKDELGFSISLEGDTYPYLKWIIPAFGILAVLFPLVASIFKKKKRKIQKSNRENIELNEFSEKISDFDLKVVYEKPSAPPRE